MDRSEEYVKMCIKAVEIQDQRPEEETICIYEQDDEDYVVWLPEQDQLQEMLTLPTKFYLLSLNRFLCAAEKRGTYFNSWEQLWLAFVMYRNFGKCWDGEDWVSVKRRDYL